MNIFTRLRSWLNGHTQATTSDPADTLAQTPQARPEHQQLPVGTLVIGCPNEWGPMVIGTINAYDERFGTVPFIDDWISGEDRMVFSPLTVFTEEAFSILVLMNPYARFNFVSKYCEVEMDKPKRGVDISTEEYVTRVGMRLAAHEAHSMGEMTP